MDKLFTNLINLLKDFAFWFINTVVEVLATLITAIANALPEYHLPVINIDTVGFPMIIPWINWFIPIDTFILCINAFLFSTVLYFTLGILTRWAKVTN